MGLRQSISNIFKKAWVGNWDGQSPVPTGVETGGIELLTKLTSGAWSKTKMLQQYEKSLYVCACVSQIAIKIGSLDLQLYQILNSKADTKELLIHPALDLIYKPNPFQTKSEFFKILEINLKLAGDAFIFKVRNESGKVVELWNLRPDWMTIVKDPVEFIREYRFTKADGTISVFEPKDIIHIKKPTPLDEYYGVSALRSAQTRVETEGFASEYQKQFFLNSARPDAILKVTNTMNLDESTKQDMRDAFEHRHSGIKNSSKIAILEGGVDYQQISLTQKEMDYINSIKFTRDDILVAFHTPKPIVSITEDVNYANAETAMRIFLEETVKPEFNDIVEKLNEELLVPDFGENLFFDFNDPTPENRDQTLKDYASGLGLNWLLINEVRQKENLPPIDGGWNFYLPLSSIPAGGLSKSEIKQIKAEYLKRKTYKQRQKAMAIFKGKPMLYRRFLIVETLRKQVKSMVQEIVEKEIKEEVVEKIKKPFIKADIKAEYADMVLKAIDRRATKLKKEVEGQAKSQHKRLNAKLNSIELGKTKAISNAAKKAIDKFYSGEQDLWAEFSLPFIQNYLQEAGNEAMDMVAPGKEFEITPAIDKALKKRAAEFGLSVNTTTRDKVTKAISDGLEAGEGKNEISDRISEIYDGFNTYRSDLIARTEATAANNEGFIAAYKQSDVATHKEWINSGDDRVRDEHQNAPVGVGGEIVALTENFSNGLPYPQEPNCRCVIGPAFEE